MRTTVRRAVSKLTEAVREMNEAHRLGMVLQTAMDHYVENPDAAPDSFDEFLVRTSGVLLREPPARKRARKARRG